MTLDTRARRAVQEIHEAVGGNGSARPEVAGAARFHRNRLRRARNQRIMAGVLAITIAIGSVVLLGRVFGHQRPQPAGPEHPNGLIVFQRSAPGLESGRLFIVAPDGSHEVALPWSVDVECATWFPDGSKILIAGTDYPGAALRPASISADGKESKVLDGANAPNLNLGCGDVSPDGTRLVLEGWNPHDPSSGGVYSVRASDGGDLVRVTHGGGEPSYLPDGRILFADPRPDHPDVGAVFIVNADGSDRHRIIPWESWKTAGDGRPEASPDGRWVVFGEPRGALGLVHPDGSELHTIPMELRPGSVAGWAQWSPDGTRIVFQLTRHGETHIYTVRPDGSDLTAIVDTPGVDEKDPAWGPAV
jgi:Tol biopolymer transport system component